MFNPRVYFAESPGFHWRTAPFLSDFYLPTQQ